jgi:glycoprotein-N-acetylgalactosamine 3-beta-galactosyltransferase
VQFNTFAPPHILNAALNVTGKSSDKKWWLGQMPPNVHPFKGALHQKGLFMKVDPSPSRLRRLDITKHSSVAAVSRACPHTPVGIEGPGVNRLLQKVKNGLRKSQDSIKKSGKSRRILCMVYTVDLPVNRNNLQSIVQTWAPKCDGFFAASNVTSHSVGAVNLPHKGGEFYNNMWQKIRSMWGYALQAYVEEYDWFYIGGDDTYLVVENLRAYLDGPDVKRLENGYVDEFSRHAKFFENANRWENVRPRPLLLGGIIFRCQNDFMITPSGGSGYLLNRAALKLLRQPGTLDTFQENTTSPREDFYMGTLMSKFGVYTSNTFDSEHGARFLLQRELIANITGSILDSHPSRPDKLNESFGVWRGDGLDGVSDGAISFHLKQILTWENGERVVRGRWEDRKEIVGDMMRRFHAILYGMCPVDNS